MTVNLDANAIMTAIQGKKTYISLGCAAIVIILNHFGFFPPGFIYLDQSNWINDLFKLLIAATGRSALANQPALIAQAHLDLLNPPVVPPPAK